MLRLRVEQPDRLDVLLQPILAKIDHLLRRLHLLKQPPRRLVHPDVGRLRREHDRDEQLKGVAELQLGLGAGVELGAAAVALENSGLIHPPDRPSLCGRSEERRGGKEGVDRSKSWWWMEQQKQNKDDNNS